MNQRLKVKANNKEYAENMIRDKEDRAYFLAKKNTADTSLVLLKGITKGIDYD